MTLDTDQATLWHAVLEAIGYDYMEITDLYRGAGVDMSRITITEGGSRSEIWNQMTSDMLGSEVITLKNAGGAGDRLYRRCLCTGTYHGYESGIDRKSGD